MTQYRLGIDTGGTFTDATLIDESTGKVSIAKVPSTPADPAIGFLNAIRRITAEQHVDAEAITYVVHGTTVATNAVIEGNVAETGFLTTEGFRDMLEIARQIRPSLYDLRFEKLRPLVPRNRSLGVPERLAADGSVLQALDESALVAAAQRLREEGVESIALCFLHSYGNPVHERRAGAILAEVFPEAMISLSSDVAPEFREYFRASTTVINAAVRPVVARYLGRIEEELRGAGFDAELLVMQSSGGVFTFEAASEKPVFMVESGPAAGVMAATWLGESLGFSNVLSFDMGGTTAKAGLVQNGRPVISRDYEVGAMAQPGGTKARGYPIRTPVIDLVEIGAGGGSIAWVDSGGGLRVGPRSAGADPGPASYGQGGTEPTITDANLVLGRIDPGYFLGGEVPLDLEKAQHAIQTRCAGPLGLDLHVAANGILDIANAAMSHALRLVSVQRGIDPRDFVLVGFGGAGPLHANELARDAGIGTTLIPMSPGTTSALGLLVTDLQHDFPATVGRKTDGVDPAELEQTFQDLAAKGRAALSRDGVANEAARLEQLADMRYAGQSFELPVTVSGGVFNESVLRELVDRFHAAHLQAYGFNAPAEPVEIVNVRVTAIGTIGKPSLARLTTPPASAQPKGERPVWFAQTGGFSPTPIYDRYTIGEGAILTGPAIVEEIDSTTVILPGYAARVDAYGNLMIAQGERQ
ncbi:MAG: hydantoinase/oxoprolinase family protein [Thermomicrobiales bacterium]|nr:hydantoinase/oxoprolinase family protein [Thermomicrobiales bacterium]